LQLKSVTLSKLDGREIGQYAEMAVQKHHILAVVPRESAEQITAHRANRLGVSRPNLKTVKVGIILPPFTCQGSLLLSPPFTLPIPLARLTRFFPLTGADLYLDSEPIEVDAPLLVNRELVAGLSPVNEAPTQVRKVDLAGSEISDLLRRFQSDATAHHS
jgi:hypothetical protein